VSTDRLFQAGNVALEGTMLGLLGLAILVALWLAFFERRDATDDWDI